MTKKRKHIDAEQYGQWFKLFRYCRIVILIRWMTIFISDAQKKRAAQFMHRILNIIYSSIVSSNNFCSLKYYSNNLWAWRFTFNFVVNTFFLFTSSSFLFDDFRLISLSLYEYIWPLAKCTFKNQRFFFVRPFGNHVIWIICIGNLMIVVVLFSHFSHHSIQLSAWNIQFDNMQWKTANCLLLTITT